MKRRPLREYEQEVSPEYVEFLRRMYERDTRHKKTVGTWFLCSLCIIAAVGIYLLTR